MKSGSDEVQALEFFAGIGLAGAGMEEAGINTVWSNDISPKKYKMYANNYGERHGHEYHVGDLSAVRVDDLPCNVHVAWASFPCTDLSLAGSRAGIHKGKASSTYWHFIKLLSRMGSDRPPIIALENVSAFATSNGGRDIRAAIRSLNGLGYWVDVVSLDAKNFLPQSRPRIFIIASQKHLGDSVADSHLRPSWVEDILDDDELRTHRLQLPTLPRSRGVSLIDFLENMDNGDDRWWSPSRANDFMSSLTPLQQERLDKITQSPTLTARTAFRRMRNGVPRWEIRRDELAGCLRTSSGGSSKQAVVIAGGGARWVRWMTPKEYAILMGAPEYRLSGMSDHAVYSGFGDGVCVPVVSWLAENYFRVALGV